MPITHEKTKDYHSKNVHSITRRTWPPLHFNEQNQPSTCLLVSLPASTSCHLLHRCQDFMLTICITDDPIANLESASTKAEQAVAREARQGQMTDNGTIDDDVDDDDDDFENY